MRRYASVIKLDKVLNEVFLAFLLKEKYCVPPLNAQNEELVSYISRLYLMSGFLLKSCIFHSNNKALVKQLREQSKIQLLRQISLETDLRTVARSLNEKGLEHVVLKGLALNSDGIHQSQIRASRDIDLLVMFDRVSEVKKVLKSLGFKTQGKSPVRHFHLPPMINQKGTKLELHWRVTSLKNFDECPLTKNMLDKRRVSSKYPEIYVPQIETTLAHILYHSFEQHKMNLGPIFLFDLAMIFNSHNRWPVDEELLDRLDMVENFKLCKKFIEISRQEVKMSRRSNLLGKKLLENSHWLELSNRSNAPANLNRIGNFGKIKKEAWLLRLLLAARTISHFYKTSYFSIKFWFLLINAVLGFVKKKYDSDRLKK